MNAVELIKLFRDKDLNWTEITEGHFGLDPEITVHLEEMECGTVAAVVCKDGIIQANPCTIQALAMRLDQLTTEQPKNTRISKPYPRSIRIC